MKLCPHCNTVKHLGAFSKYARGRLGVQVYCRECQAAMRLARIGANPAKERARRNKYVKGTPKGHPGARNPRWRGGRFVNDAGYVMILMPDHSRAAKHGYVREHLLVAERALGRTVPIGVHVHHVNGVPSDNRPENLIICENGTYHKLLHRRQRALEACGHPTWLRCAICKGYGEPSLMYVRPRGDSAHHRSCHAQYQSMRNQ